jgi:hypothetical protein
VTDAAAQQLADAWRQCQRHAHHLRQFVLRFGRLQDAIGARLLPAVLRVLQEPFEDRPMIDKLNRLANVAFQSVDDVVAILRRIEQKMTLPPV